MMFDFPKLIIVDVISLAGLAADWNLFAFSNHNITESQSQNIEEELRIMCLVMTQETFPKICFRDFCSSYYMLCGNKDIKVLLPLKQTFEMLY